MFEHGQEVSEEDAETVKKLAAQVVNHEHFRQIIWSATPSLRKKVYDQLAPLLPFKAKPYYMMMLSKKSH